MLEQDRILYSSVGLEFLESEIYLKDIKLGPIFNLYSAFNGGPK